MSATILITFLVVALLGMPLAFALGFSALTALTMSGVDFNMLPQRMMHSVNAFPLMAIPLFMLAGELMLRGGLAERLIELANAFIGRVAGGLAQVTMLAGAGMASVSGAAVADASALATVLVHDSKHGETHVSALRRLGHRVRIEPLPGNSAEMPDAVLIGSPHVAAIGDVRREGPSVPLLVALHEGDLDAATTLLGVDRLAFVSAPWRSDDYALALASLRLELPQPAGFADNDSGLALRLVFIRHDLAEMAAQRFAGIVIDDFLRGRASGRLLGRFVRHFPIFDLLERVLDVAREDVFGRPLLIE